LAAAFVAVAVALVSSAAALVSSLLLAPGDEGSDGGAVASAAGIRLALAGAGTPLLVA
jgi:hypothetical protein